MISEHLLVTLFLLHSGLLGLPPCSISAVLLTLGVWFGWGTQMVPGHNYSHSANLTQHFDGYGLD